MNGKILVLFFIIIGAISGCEKTTTQLCGGADPANDLPWLRNEISRLNTLTTCTSISRSVYKDQTVFIFSNCEPHVNSIPFLYQCDGNRLDLNPADYQDLKFTGDIELIWKSK